MMTGELFMFFFAALGAYVVACVWHRTAEERREQQLRRLARPQRRDGERDEQRPRRAEA